MDKIIIKKSPNADSRTASADMTKEIRQMEFIKQLTDKLQESVNTHERDRAEYIKARGLVTCSHAFRNTHIRPAHIKLDIRRIRRELIKLYELMEERYMDYE